LGRKGFDALPIIIGLILILPASYYLFLTLEENANYDYFTAISGSMEPIFSLGDTLKFDPNFPIDEIYAAPKTADPPGDIIIYRGGPRSLSVHRVVDKTIKNDGTYSFKTWGDANSSPEIGEVNGSDVRGKVVDINPPFWTHNFLFWAVLLEVGIILLVIGLVLIAISRG
jgi:signal peptidase I